MTLGKPKKINQSILYIVDKTFPSDENFIEEVFTKLIPNLGYSASLIIRTNSKIIPKIKNWNHVNLHFFSNEMASKNPLIRIWRMIYNFLILYKVLKKNEYDILHVRNWVIALIYSKIFSSIFDFKIVFQLSYDQFELRNENIKRMQGIKKQFNYVRNEFWRKVSLIIMKRVDVVLPITDLLKEKLISRGLSEKKLFAIPYGAINDLIKYDQNYLISKKLKLCPKSKKIILCLGTCEPERRVEFVIDAYRKLNKVRDDCFLLIIGGLKKDAERLRKYSSSMGITDNIKILERVPRKNVDMYYQLCDFSLSVLPPIEAFHIATPGKLIDSFSNGRAVIASKLYEQKKIVEESNGGILIDYNINELMKAMDWMLQNTENTKVMGQSGKTFIEKKMSYSSIVKEIDKIYKNLF